MDDGVDDKLEQRMAAEVQRDPQLSTDFARIKVSGRTEKMEVLLERMFHDEILADLAAEAEAAAAAARTPAAAPARPDHREAPHDSPALRRRAFTLVNRESRTFGTDTDL